MSEIYIDLNKTRWSTISTALLAAIAYFATLALLTAPSHSGMVS